MVLGHEAAGVVTEVGDGVTNVKEGDRVAIEPGVPCRACSYCKTGVYNLCPQMSFCATPPVHGNLCRHYVHAADFCYKLPDHMSLEEGALMEARAMGASEVVITDIMDNRLEVAKSMGATHTYKVTRERTAEEAAADIASLLGGEAPDVCIECSGAEPS